MMDIQSQLPYREFVQQYLLPRRPVILTDAISQWTAVSRWTPEYLKDKIGDRKAPFRGPPESQCTFHEVAEQIVNSTPEKPGVYMQNVNIQRDLPEVFEDVTPRIRYAIPDWKSSRLMPKDQSPGSLRSCAPRVWQPGKDGYAEGVTQSGARATPRFCLTPSA